MVQKLHRPRAVGGNQKDQVLKTGGAEFPQHLFHARGLELENAVGIPGGVNLPEYVRLKGQVVQIHRNAVPVPDLVQGVRNAVKGV